MDCVPSATWSGGDQSPAAAGPRPQGRSSGSRSLDCREGAATYGEVVAGDPRGADVPDEGPRHVELALHYPEVAIRGPIVHEARDSRGAEGEDVPLAGAPSVAGEGPLRVLRQRDVGGGSLARAATTAIPTAIARASHAASAKGSPYRTGGVAAATVGPGHFYLGAQGRRFRHTSTLSAFKNAQDAGSAGTQLDRHSQRHRRQL